MFGIASFSAVPFSSLSGAAFSVTVDESVTLTETQTVVANFNVARSESLTLTEAQNVLAQFMGMVKIGRAHV